MNRIIAALLALLMVPLPPAFAQSVNAANGLPVRSTIIHITNAGSTGTTVNTLTKLTGAPSTAVIAATTDTSGIIGVTTGGAGTSGIATIQINGLVSLVMDGATTAGDYVQISTTTAGNGHDTGAATCPTSGQVIGRVLTTNGSGGTYSVNLGPNGCGGSGASSSFQWSALPNPPASTGFSWVNQQSGSTVNQSGGTGNPIVLDLVGLVALNWQLRTIAVPGTTPWRVSARIACTETPAPPNSGSAVANTATCGLYLSDGTKLEGIELLQAGTGTLALTQAWRVEHITNVTTDGSTAWGGGNGAILTFTGQEGAYLAWCYDGTNLYAEYSLEGQFWNQIIKETSPFLTPTTVGPGGLFTGSTSTNAIVSMQSWNTQTGVTCPN